MISGLILVGFGVVLGVGMRCLPCGRSCSMLVLWVWCLGGEFDLLGLVYCVVDGFCGWVLCGFGLICGFGGFIWFIGFVVRIC